MYMCMNIPFKIFFRWGDFMFLMKISFSVHIPFRKYCSEGMGDLIPEDKWWANVWLGVISPGSSHVYPSKMGPSQELGERLGDPIRREKEVKVQLSSLGAVGMNTAYTML